MSTDPDGSSLRPGVRLVGGGTITFPVGSVVITLGDDGQPIGMEVREFLVATSTWIDWLHVAFERLVEVRAARHDLVAAVQVEDEEVENAALEHEVRASLQVVAAAVFGLDGFYGQIQQHVTIPEVELESRRRNRTARHIWVADAISRTARIPNGFQPILRTNIKKSYSVRDLAVHSDPVPRPPGIHPGLRQMVPSYVSTFSLETSEGVLRTCVEAVLWVLDHPRATEGPVFDLAGFAGPLVHRLVDPHIKVHP